MFQIKFAIQVATTDDSQIQNILMDAFDDGVVTTNNFGQAQLTSFAKTRPKMFEKQFAVYAERIFDRIVWNHQFDMPEYSAPVGPTFTLAITTPLPSATG